MYEEIIISDELKDAAVRMMREDNVLRFCILEDMNTKKYIIFDLENDWQYMIVPFGDILKTVLNCFLDSSETSIYHRSLSDIVNNDTIEKMKQCKPMLKKLLDIITNMEANSIYPDKVALKCAYIHEWKRYRYINCVEIYSKYADYFSDNFSKEDIELYGSIEALKKAEEEELDEISAGIHSVVCKKDLVFYDTVYIPCSNGFVYGKVWFASIIEYVFSRELYHLFVDNTIEQPHICPRCGHFYYSNNNKSKYCDSCKDNYSEIRKEYRQKNKTRYIHKKINDKLHSKRYSEEELDKFMIESNYYWDIVKQKEPKTKPESWYLNINTEEEYKNWLESKLNEYSARK